MNRKGVNYDIGTLTARKTLLNATAMTRECFHGQLTYASGSWEAEYYSMH
jgi:hypothetical protein